MNIFKAYFSGFKESARIPKPVFLIYIINLILGVLLAIPFFGLLKKELAYTDTINSLLYHFDFALFADFIRNSKTSLGVLFSQFFWIALVYWVLSIFLSGGIIRTLNQDKFTMTSFFSGAGYNFFRFLKISMLNVIIQLLIIVVVFTPALMLISDETTENAMFWILGCSSFIWILLALLVLVAVDYSKFYSVLYDKGSLRQAVRGGLKYVRSHFLRTHLLYLLLLIFPVLFLAGYLPISNRINPVTGFEVFLVFILQQVVILLRIWMRVWSYAAPLQMFTADFLKNEDVQMRIAIMNEWNEKAKAQQLGLTEIAKVTEAEISNEDLRAESVEEKVLTEEEVLRQIREEEERQKELEREEKRLKEAEEERLKEQEKEEKRKAKEEEELRKQESENVKEPDLESVNENKDLQDDASEIKNRTKDNKAKALEEIKNELKNAKTLAGDMFSKDTEENAQG